MTMIEFLKWLIRKNEANTRHAQERRDDEALKRLDETRQHLFAELRAMERAEQIGAMFEEDIFDYPDGEDAIRNIYERLFDRLNGDEENA